MPTRRRRSTSLTFGSVTERPSTTTSPPSIGASRLMQRSTVDLPLPEGPMMQQTSPGSTARLISLRTSFEPNALRTWDIVIIAIFIPLSGEPLLEFLRSDRNRIVDEEIEEEDAHQERDP